MEVRFHCLLSVLLLLFVFGDEGQCPCSVAPYRFMHRPEPANGTDVDVELVLPDRLNVCAPLKIESMLKRHVGDHPIVDNFVFLSDLSLESKIAAGCHGVLSLSTDSVDSLSSTRPICPMGCEMFVELNLPESLLSMDAHSWSGNYAVTCSLTVQEMLSRWKRGHHIQKRYGQNWALFLIHESISRQYYECSEHASLLRFASPSTAHLISSTVHSKAVPGIHRRKLLGLVIWIGTSDRLHMVHAQTTTLAGIPFHRNREAVVGWAATDLLYPCHPDAISCPRRGMRRYQGLFPSSAINFMPPGWGCAQRRPLRALAHSLLFFDPQFLVLLDDDTFFNWPRFQTTLLPFVLQNMSVEPMYLGEALGRTGPEGHLSTIGCFIGGSGYIMGKKVLDRITSREIGAFGNEYLIYPGARSKTFVAAPLDDGFESQGQAVEADSFRSLKHIQALGLFQEALELSSAFCARSNLSAMLSNLSSIASHPLGVSQSALDGEMDTEVDSCLLHHHEFRSLFHASVQERQASVYDLPSDSSGRKGIQSIPIAVRLIDLCSNMMASEHTCLHSDHSVGRCLLYGAAATPVMTACRNTTLFRTRDSKPDPFYGMCFMAPECDLQKQVTCHRYQPDERGLPIRTSSSPGHYKKYSSFFNGQILDSDL